MAGLTIGAKYLSGEYRPCMANGKKGLFHRWVEEEKLIIKIESIARKRPEYLNVALQDYRENGIIGPGMSTEKIKYTFALVEFEDGHVDKVEPTIVIFEDSYEKFKSYAWSCDFGKEV